MATQDLATQLNPLDIAPDGLLRVTPEVYRALAREGIIDPREVVLADGLLIDERGRGEGPSERLFRLTLADYERLAALELLEEAGQRVELIDGLLVFKLTKDSPHVLATKLVVEALRALIPPGWHVAKEDPVAHPAGLSGRPSMPEPDAVVLRGGIRDYARRRPVPADVSLVVEVADSALRSDRVKLARYAWSGIPVAWLVNLNDRTLEVHTNPSGPAASPVYQVITTYRAADEVPVTVDGRKVGQVVVAELLP